MATFNSKCLLIFLILISVFITGSIENQNKRNHRLHATKRKTSFHLRENLQKCYLTCPDGSRTEIPTNILQNCTSINHSSSSQPPVINNNGTATLTTEKPTTANTSNSTSSSEESNEDEESGSEEEETTATTKRPSNGTGRIHRKQLRNKQKRKHRHHVKKQLVLLNRKAKSKIFRHLKSRANLNGCHVECYDITNEQPVTTNQPDNGGHHPEVITDSSEENNDNDNYIQGEDTPIEIIYVPNNKENNYYQTNNIIPEMWDPQPVYPPLFDSNQYFFEDKRLKVKKRTKNDKKKIEKHGDKKKHI